MDWKRSKRSLHCEHMNSYVGMVMLLSVTAFFHEAIGSCFGPACNERQEDRGQNEKRKSLHGLGIFGLQDLLSTSVLMVMGAAACVPPSPSALGLPGIDLVRPSAIGIPW